jgi:hypothetical protein
VGQDNLVQKVLRLLGWGSLRWRSVSGTVDRFGSTSRLRWPQYGLQPGPFELQSLQHKSRIGGNATLLRLLLRRHAEPFFQSRPKVSIVGGCQNLRRHVFTV